MPLTPEAIEKLLRPYLSATPAEAVSAADWPRIREQLREYLALIMKWNARINLTAIHAPEAIVQRHFGESLFAGLRLGNCSSLLDFGSGAGFPGLPIQILRPELPVTLAESRHKKASFLREVIRTLGLNTHVWAERVQAMPAGELFHTVTLRAVDEMDQAVGAASERAGHQLAILGTTASSYPALQQHFAVPESFAIPETIDGSLMLYARK